MPTDTLIRSELREKTLILFLDRPPANTLTREMLVSMLTPQLVIVLAAVFLLWLGIRGGLAPLDEVAAEIERRDPSDLRPFPDSGPAEVRPLTSALNAMLNALTAAQASQRRFISNAAHQLRTPLATLRVQLEMARREQDPERHAKALGEAVSALTRMNHMLHQLLTLAKVDHAAKEVIASTDLDLLARQEVESYFEHATARGVEMKLSASNVALIMLCGFDEPVDFATTSCRPKLSKIARIGPPAMMPVPGFAARITTRPAP